MRIRGYARALLIGSVCLGVQPGFAAPAQDLGTLYGTPPGYTAASLSPGGKYLAFVTPGNGTDSVLIVPLNSADKPSRFSIPDSITRNVFWRNEDQFITTARFTTRFEYGRSFGAAVGRVGYRYSYVDYVVSPAGKKGPTALKTRNPQMSGPTASFADLNLGRPDRIFVSSIMPGAGGYDTLYAFTTDLLSVNLDTGFATLARNGEPETVKWFMDGSGNVLARLDISDAREDQVFVPDGDKFRRVANLKDADGHVVGLTEDGKGLAVLARRQNDRQGLYRLNLADGVLGDPLFFNPNSDVRNVLFDERTLRVVGVTYEDGVLRYSYFAPERQNVQKQIEDALPGRTVSILSISADQKKILVSASGPQSPPVLQFVDLEAGKINNVVEAYPQLRGTMLGEVRRYSYSAKDGKTLTGLLTLPPGKEERGLPLVVLPSGGFGYTDGAFDWFAQYLAHRGYAVFQSGARDAKALGDVYGMDELSTWMLGSQQDIVSGIDDLVAKEIANPKRICIAGAGSSGYIALSAPIFMPDKYACAVNLAGLSDIRVLLRGSGDAARITANVFSSTLIRNRNQYSDADLERFSPARHADVVKTPILLLVGDRDWAKEQLDTMNDALVHARKPVEYVLLKSEDGTLSRTENRVALLNAVDKFLAKHIGK